MKRFPLVLTYSFLGLALFANPVTEGQKKFIKGNIADKTADILKNREIQSNEDVSFNWISRFIDSAKDSVFLE